MVRSDERDRLDRDRQKFQGRTNQVQADIDIDGRHQAGVDVELFAEIHDLGDDVAAGTDVGNNHRAVEHAQDAAGAEPEDGAADASDAGRDLDNEKRGRGELLDGAENAAGLEIHFRVGDDIGAGLSAAQLIKREDGVFVDAHAI